MTVFNDTTERLPHLLQIRRLTTKPAQSRLSVGDRPGDGLFHFMGDRSRELPHRGDAVGVRQLQSAPRGSVARSRVPRLPLACARSDRARRRPPRSVASSNAAAPIRTGTRLPSLREILLFIRLARLPLSSSPLAACAVAVAPFRRRQVGPAHDGRRRDRHGCIPRYEERHRLLLPLPAIKAPDKDADDV